MTHLIRGSAAGGVAALLLLAGCGDEGGGAPARLGQAIYFNGMAYDGAVGARLTNYDIRLLYLDREYRGEIDGSGRFFLGPLQPMSDYTVAITADGYRSFLSHNPGYETGGRSFYFDAYLFPGDIAAPDVEFRISLSDSTERPGGFLRLAPTAPSLLYDEPRERPAGVDTQVWDNDEDLQFRTVSVPFADGVADVSGAELVYGVTYAATVFGVPGYQPLVSPYQSGVDGDQGLILEPLDRTPITVAYRSDVSGANENGTLVIVFNLPVEFDPPALEGEFTEAVDGALAVGPYDRDGDGNVNELEEDLDPAVIERGTELTLDENQLTIQWDPEVALAEADANDPVNFVTYGALGAVRLRPVGTDASQGVSLGSLLGVDSVTVQLSP